MIIGYQSRKETHQTLGIITVITLEEIHRHEDIKKNPQSNQIANSSKLAQFVLTAETSLQHFTIHRSTYIPVLKLTLCLGQFPVIAFRLIHILPSIYALKTNC
jgi:hypothetical protein